ncbi:MAG TPA: hypothetical protein PKC41_09175 [Chitinophagaceae bacterium]|jgi:hypothetical protein|nr:hypothetical protein [Chitinophagaceae bacterium]
MIKTYTAIPIITKGNLLFRDKITIDTQRRLVYFQKRSNNLFGYTNKSIKFNDISSVHLVHRAELLLFSRVAIETTGGEIISASGLKLEDAKELKYFLDNL